MPISCINTGWGFWKSYEQKFSIGSIFALFFFIVVVIVTGVFGVGAGDSYKGLFCESMGITVEKDNTTMMMVFIVACAVCLIMAGMTMYYSFTDKTTKSGYVPSIILFVFSILFGVAAWLSTLWDDVPTSSQQTVDPNVRNWCLSENTTSKTANIVLLSLLVIFIAGTVSYTSYVVTKICQIY